jgi:hypothetical protein
MKLFLKIGKLLAILVLTVSIILLTASFLLKDKVGYIILRSFNKNLSTKIDVGSFKLSFIRKFPNASLELKNVLVHSSPNFSSASFQGINTDTLLSARSVLMEFKLTDILKGVYTIERISARAGKANFFTDSTGHVNYNISVKHNDPSTKETIIDLKRINLNDIDAYYNSLTAHLIIRGEVKTGKFKSRISGSTIDFIGGSDLLVNYFQLYKFSLDKPIPAKLDLNLQSAKQGITFRKGIIHIDDYDFGIAGFVSSDNILDLNLTGNNLDISRIRNHVPEKFLSSVSDYDPSGVIMAKSTIKGKLSRTSNPHIEITWQLRNGRVAYKKSVLTFKGLSFAGNFSNGSENRASSSSVSITDFKGKLGSSEYTGSATMKEFNNPLIDLSLKGRVYPEEWKEFFGLHAVSTASGSVDLDLKMVNSSWSKKNFSFDDFIDLKPQANLTFNSFTLGVQNNKILFARVSGNMNISNSVHVKDIQFNYKGQNIKINGEFKNLLEWISGRTIKMTAKADVFFDKLNPETFFKESASSDKSGSNQKAFSLPGDLVVDINFRIDSLSYKTFSSTGFVGTLSYQPKVLTFKSLNMKSLNGTISGNGFFLQNSNKGLIAKGNFIVTNIDVNRAFTTFHNFGQSFLKAENIKGTLSGTLSLLFPIDSVLTFHIKTLTAEGKYHLVNGALINFDPVKQLSSFIELSELENINFDKLENDFFIRNNFLFIPQMEVKSSAANLSVNGKHSFDNDYEYHVKILLSEILSKKRHKNKSNVTEFGVVEDDGLGHTSLLLKIIGKGEEAKVNYDGKAARTEVKDNFKKEGKTLKTILNQEYGWYKNDSAVKQKPAEKKSRFKVTWDDSDTVDATTNPPVGKNISKKK